MDVRGAQLDHAADEGVDQADDGRLAGQVAQVLDEVARALLVQRAFAGVGGIGLLVLALQGLGDVGGQAHGRVHGQAGGQVQGLEHEGVLRRAHGHVQAAVLGTQRQHMVRTQEVGQQAGQIGRHLGKGLGRHEGQAQVLGQRARGVQLGHQAQADQHAVERAAHLVLGRQRALQLARAELAGAHQQLAVFGPAHGEVGGRGRRDERVGLGRAHVVKQSASARGARWGRRGAEKTGRFYGPAPGVRAAHATPAAAHEKTVHRGRRLLRPSLGDGVVGGATRGVQDGGEREAACGPKGPALTRLAKRSRRSVTGRSKR